MALSLKGKTVFITGASRGIGKAIGLRAARDGANVVIAAKTADPNPKLPGTIYSAKEEIEAAGGKALACIVDVRFEEQIQEATPLKRFDLMHGINTRGTFACSQACIPYLAKSDNPHILNISPPLNMEARWFAPHVAYTMAKFGMSMCVLGMAEELKGQKIAVNALWPKTVIATAAVQNLLGGDASIRGSRKPDIMADAAHAILTRKSSEFTGQFCIDETVLRESGVADLSSYAMTPGMPDSELFPDYFL
jgi:citronellol/citronellal dehydrogenase